ncbi:ATP-binding protein [Kitasatospora sp. NPDC056531]|uniref:ATP-binding protein n=1 Tax=Kitasatospora sp. NPDC056531 TaxID=3345856 RepID=UPI0036C3543B
MTESPSVPLFGRDTELARLTELLPQARRGYGEAVLIEGEPGSGKTTLVQALEADALAAGFTLVRGCCDEAAGEFPLLPVLDALGVHRRGEDAARAEIRQLLRTGAGANQDAIPALIERLLGLVETACEERPVLLFIDDLQWVDDATAIWWQRLARQADQLPLLLVGAVRSRAVGAAVDALRRGRTRRQGPLLRLGPLDTAALTALAEHHLGAPPGPRLTQLLTGTGGSPLCAVEFLGHVGREGLLRPAADGSRAVDLATELVGATLAGAVRNRISHLGPEDREFLQTLSVLGPEFGTQEALAVLDGSARELAPRFTGAQALGLIGLHGSTTAFRNPLLQERLYEDIPLALRASLHTRAAERLEAADAPLDRVLRQLTKAAALSDSWAPRGSWSRTWLHEHSEALVNRAPAIAVELLSPLLDPAAPDGRLYLAVVNALHRVHRLEQVPVLCRQLLASDADPATVGEASFHLAIQLHIAGRLVESVDVIEQALSRGDIPPRWLATLHAQRGPIEHHLGRPEAAQHHLDRAIELGRSCEAWFAVGLANWFSAFFAESVDPHLALQRIEDAIDALRRDPSERYTLVIALSGRLRALRTLDRTADIEDTVDSLRRTTEHSGGVTPLTTTVDLAKLRFQQGRWDEATAEIDHLVDQDTAEHWLLFEVHAMLAAIAAHRGDDAALRRHLDLCADRPTGEFDFDTRQLLALANAVAADRAGDRSRATTALLECLDPERIRQQGMRFHWLPYLVRFALAAGDRAAAAHAAEVCRAEAEHAAIVYWQQAAAHCEALLAGDAVALLDVAAYYQRTERPLEHAQTLQDAARAFTASGDHRQAEDAAARAAAECRRLGVPYGADAPSARREWGWESLTATEQRIARMAAQAMSNPGIAAELNLPRRTVQTHVSRILTKLGLRSRVEIPHHIPADPAEW